MNEEEKKEEPKRGPGQPTKYRPEYCLDLVDHMALGHSIDSFPAVLWKKYKVMVRRETLYNWKGQFDEFFNTMDLGLASSLLFYENLGNQGMAGQLRRVISETKLADGKGVNRKYKSAMFNYRAWELVMRNRFGYRGPQPAKTDPESSSVFIPDQVTIDIPDNGMDRPEDG